MGQNGDSGSLKELHSYYKNRLPPGLDVHAAAQEEEMAKSQAPSWGDMPNTTPTEEEENWDVVDSQSATEDQFDDVVIEEEEVLIHTMYMDEKELDQCSGGGTTRATGRSR